MKTSAVESTNWRSSTWRALNWFKKRRPLIRVPLKFSRLEFNQARHSPIKWQAKTVWTSQRTNLRLPTQMRLEARNNYLTLALPRLSDSKLNHPMLSSWKISSKIKTTSYLVTESPFPFERIIRAVLRGWLTLRKNSSCPQQFLNLERSCRIAFRRHHCR